MFNNLIESSSHANEFKRRGSFLLFTTATYLMLFVITGVASIYAYDAHLESQSTEWEIITFAPAPPPEAVPEPPRNTTPPASNSNATATRSERTELIDTTSNPNNPPVDVGIKASPVPPAREDSVLSYRNVDPITPASGNRAASGGTGNTPVVNIPDNPPPPAPVPTPPPTKLLKISVVLNSRALSLPKPNYPPMALQIRAHGVVTVQILIDETGKVISAKAVAGHPLLIHASQRAALQARFSPTILSDQPVKVSGVITYNFVLP